MAITKKKFFDMIGAVWHHPSDKLLQTDNSSSDFFIPVLALTQFYFREYFWYKYYRYWWIFSYKEDDCDISEVFINRFGTNYHDFLMFGYVLKVMYYSEVPVSSSALNYLINEKYPEVGNALAILREEYIKELRRMLSDPNDKSDYIYCVRPSYTYALVGHDNKWFLPLPHLLTRNITSSLLYRITDPNIPEGNELRSQIGKNVLEKYLYKIIKESDVYDEVCTEIQYRLPHNNSSKSPDVMVRKGSHYFFFDSKASVPGKGLRLFDQNVLDRTQCTLAKYIIQLYRQLMLFPEKYNPFCGDTTVNQDNVWGAVVVLEDPYIRRKGIYKKVYETLNIEEESAEAKWIANHIKILSLYQIECYSFTSTCLIEAMKDQAETGKPYDYTLYSKASGNATITNPSLLAFRNRIDEEMQLLIKEMDEKSVI